LKALLSLYNVHGLKQELPRNSILALLSLYNVHGLKQELPRNSIHLINQSIINHLIVFKAGKSYRRNCDYIIESIVRCSELGEKHVAEQPSKV